MSVWIAFVIVASTGIMSPALDVPLRQMTVETAEKNAGPSVNIELKDSPSWKIGRMTGVESTVVVNVPTTSLLEFQTEASCEVAAGKLRNASGITSVICIESERQQK